MSKLKGNDRDAGFTTEIARQKPDLLRKIYLAWVSGESYSGLEKRFRLRGNNGNTAWRCCRLLEKNYRIHKQTDRTSDKVQQLVAVLQAPAATLIDERKKPPTNSKPARSFTEAARNRARQTNLFGLISELERIVSALKEEIG